MHIAKKSFGQNFLKSEQALRTMCTTGEIKEGDIILEIGPGKGALTEKLLEKSKKIIAIEKDRDLITILEEKFKKEIDMGTLVLIRGDILEFDPEVYQFKNQKYKIVANIPYNITGAIFKKFLSGSIQPSKMVLLVQKEVAMRIVANDKKESILSLSVKAYGEPKYIMKVGKRFFSPSPKVDSAIIAVTNISRNNFKDKEMEESFFTMIKTAFAHKRKVLKKNLELVASPTVIDKVFTNLKINPKVRAEDLSFDMWINIVKYLSKHIGDL